MRTISAKYASVCPACKGAIAVGAVILYDDNVKKAYHLECRAAEQADLLAATEAENLADKLGFE